MSKTDLNEFVVLCVHAPNTEFDDITMPKVSFDKKIFYDIPSDYQQCKHHPEIMETSEFRAFLKYCKDKIAAGLNKLWIRNFKFKIKKEEGSLTSEASRYIQLDKDNQLVFVFNKVPLSKETENDKSVLIDDWSFSLEELGQLSGLNLLALDEKETSPLMPRKSVSSRIDYFNNNSLNQDNQNSNVNNQISLLHSNLNSANQYSNSTPITSGSNLRSVFISSLGSEAPLNKFLVSTIFNDQKKLKEIFKTFKLFGEVDSSSWFALVKGYCTANYQNPSEIIDYLALFIEDELHSWFYNLKSTEKANLESIEVSFLQMVHDKEVEYHDLVVSKQSSFMDSLKIKYSTNKKFLEELDNAPLSTFIRSKMLIIKKVYPSITKQDAVRITIFSIDDKNVKKQFSKLVKSDLKDIISIASSVDLYNKK